MFLIIFICLLSQCAFVCSAASAKAARSLAESFDEIEDENYSEFENGAEVFGGESGGTNRIRSPSRESKRSVWVEEVEN